MFNFILSSLLIIQLISLISCSKDGNIQRNKFVYNDKPLYSEREFIRLESLFSVDIDNVKQSFIRNVTWMDADNDTNLYVLDMQESKVIAFDKYGVYLRTFGHKGYGPTELKAPMNFFIWDDKLYIYENFRGIKIWTKWGKYIDFIPLNKIENTEIFKRIGDYFIGLSYSLSERNINAKSLYETWHIATYTNGLKIKKNIMTAEIERSDINKHFRLDYFLAYDSKNNIYLPAKRDDYIIDKFSIQGDCLFSFGRKYERRPYSEITIEAFNELYKDLISANSMPRLEGFPQIIRNIAVDEKDYLWIGVGECNFDNINQYPVKNTIDIFNADGQFIFTFETPLYWGYNTLLKYSRLYTVPTRFDKSIHVFSIHYNL